MRSSPICKKGGKAEGRKGGKAEEAKDLGNIAETYEACKAAINKHWV